MGSAAPVASCTTFCSMTAVPEGAVRAAEWLRGRKGFYDFREIFRDLDQPKAKPNPARTKPGPRRRTATPRKRSRTRAK